MQNEILDEEFRAVIAGRGCSELHSPEHLAKSVSITAAALTCRPLRDDWPDADPLENACVKIGEHASPHRMSEVDTNMRSVH